MIDVFKMKETFGAPLLAAALATALAGGCASGRGPITTIDSEPAGALVKVDGFGECETPCVIQHDAPRRVTVAKAGFRKRVFDIRPGDGEVVVELELAAPTEEVETDALPPLR